jgi:hypothetical protein
MPDHGADNNRMHSASPHFTNYGVAKIVPATNLNPDSFCGGM